MVVVKLSPTAPCVEKVFSYHVTAAAQTLSLRLKTNPANHNTQTDTVTENRDLRPEGSCGQMKGVTENWGA